MAPLLELLSKTLLLILVEGSLVLPILGILHLPVVDIDLVQLGKLFLFLLKGIVLVGDHGLLLSLVPFLTLPMPLLDISYSVLVVLPELLELLPVAGLHPLKLDALLLDVVLQHAPRIGGPRSTSRLLQHSDLLQAGAVHRVLIRGCPGLLGSACLERGSTHSTWKLPRGASEALLSRFTFGSVATLIAPEGVGLACRIVEVKISST